MPERHSALGEGTDGGRRSLVIWRFSDGKAGHDNQSLGLAEALAREVRCEIHLLAPLGASTALLSLTSGRISAYDTYPDPDLILGAGHSTHLSMLAARRARRGRVVVLMKPSLPKCVFDLCLIPEHDRPEITGNVLATRGALNRVRPSPEKDGSSGLILLGGTSAGFVFDQPRLLDQIDIIFKRNPNICWTVATSRRTPTHLADRLRSIEAKNFTVVTMDETGPDWLATQLSRAALVWVTEDSASMVYEALTSGAAVGLLSLKRKKPGRVARGMDRLIRNGVLTRFCDWGNGRELTAPREAFDEATRCARIILDRWPNLAVPK